MRLSRLFRRDEPVKPDARGIVALAGLWPSVERHYNRQREKARRFACWCALQVAHLWKEPMPEVVRRYLETGDESLKAAARAAARAAAWAAQYTKLCELLDIEEA